MALVVKDRVKVSTSTTGTGTLSLGSAATGYQSFSAVGNGNTTYYTIASATSSEWEVGLGTYTSSGNTLSRDTVLSSSNAGALVNFSAGSKDVFVTYPAEKAIYEEATGNVLIDGGPITVLGTGVAPGGYTSFSGALGEMYADSNAYAQFYAQNLNDGADASTDIVAYNNLGDGTYNFVDMGIASSNYTSATYPIFTPASAYLYNDGGELIVGTATAGKDLILFAGGVDTTDEAVRISGTNLSVSMAASASIAGALGVTGAATFGSTVLLNANPTLALQAATKAYVDQQVTAGLHIHEPVRVETTGNLTATYTGGGTNANIVQIANGTDITFFSVTPSVGDQFYIGSSSNGLIANTAYFVVNIVSGSTVQASLTFDGAIVTGLTNGSPTIPSVINSGVGATLTNSGAQAALSVDGVSLSVNDRVMVRLQTTGAQNGVYTVTTVGSGSTNWVLTRAADASIVSPSDPNGLGTGDYFFTQEGLLNAGDSHVLTTEPNTMIIGYTTLTYTQFSGSVDYVGGTNITVTGQTISVSGTIAATLGGTGTSTVAIGDLLYGSGTDTWGKLAVGSAYRSLLVNAAGTQVEWNAVALNQANAVSGTLGATNGGTAQSTYATGDTLYASAANTLSKLSGNTSVDQKVFAQTGTGSASAAPEWTNTLTGMTLTSAKLGSNLDTNGYLIVGGSYGGNQLVLPVGFGPTLQGLYEGNAFIKTGTTGSVNKTWSFTDDGAFTSPGAVVGTSFSGGSWTGSTIGATYGGTGFSSYTVGDILYADTTTSLAKLADVASGNALISGGVGVAPSYGKIGLATHVSGTLPVANGGTGVTSSTGTGSVVLSDSPSLVTPALGAPASGDFSSGTFTWPTFNQNTSGTAAGLSTTLAITSGGTGQTTATAAFNALAPAQGSSSGKYLTTDGTNASWATVNSGASISNDTTTATNVYPLFADVTTGVPTVPYTGHSTLLYTPSTGELQSTVLTASNGIVVTASTVNADYTIASGFNGMSVGPISIATGATVTIASDSTWTIV